MSFPALAETCPGNPDALGTSRVLTINPGEFTLIGTMQYEQTLALRDREVVITFDDGPLPPYTDIILDTLASQCVKATYFLVGQMARPIRLSSGASTTKATPSALTARTIHRISAPIDAAG